MLVHNLLSTLQGQDASTRIVGYGKVMLSEFDYDFGPLSEFDLDPTIPRYSMWLLKLYGLPALYWQGMLRGLV